ncbi:type II toxin-antitoxin system RelE/ParE family toxin [Mucilaginibacter terrae]|uniref:type II toxin-antitoxin system RelE/ParE family toxin n=1 Tax=Mucilaginibacter terrae TaxID=1955052 RepID=UPI0036264316
MNGLVQNALRYNVRFSEKYRFAPLNVYPYLIVYRVHELKKTVYILSVFHTSRNSNKFS